MTFFRGKAAKYRKSKNYLTSSIAEINTVGAKTSINRINQKLRSFTDWTAGNIDIRHEILMNLAKEIWTTEPLALD